MGRMPFQDGGPRALSGILLGSIVAGCTCFGSTAAGADEHGELLRRGERAREAGDLRTAVELFREAIRQRPQHPNAYIKAAEAYENAFARWELSYCDLAGRSLWAAPDDWRKHAEPRYRFSILHEPGMPTEPSHDETVPIEVLYQRELAERATRLVPENSSAWRWLGEAYLVLADEAEAERCFRRAVELTPEDAALRSRVSRVYRAWKRPAEALPHLDAAVRLAPNEPAYLLFRSACRCELGDIDGATEDLKAFGISPEGVAELERVRARSDSAAQSTQAMAFHSCYIRLRPKDASAYDARAEFLLKAKAHEKALEDIDSALTIQPRHPMFLYRRASALHLLGRHEEALETITRVCQLRPYEPAVEAMRALCLKDLGRYEEAEGSRRRSEWLQEWLKNREAIDESPENPAAWLDGGRLALEGGEYGAAKTCFARVVELTPNAVTAHHGLALACLRLGEPKAALAAADRAVEIDSDNASYRSTRAEVRLATGDLDGAIADYEQAQRAGQAFGPQVAEAYLRRAEHRASKGNAAGAAADRERAAALQANPFGVP